MAPPVQAPAAEPPARSADGGAIAHAFVAARRAGRSLPDYPGLIPPDLPAAYAIQEQAIQLFKEEIVGWKIGRIAPALQAQHRTDRLAGPIFRSNLMFAGEEAVPFGVFDGGYAAVEPEVVFRLARSAPAEARSWSLEDAAAMIGAAHIGVEIAGSPLAAINDLGPTVVVSDFGNNGGLILGPAAPDWRNSLADIVCETSIDGVVVGRKPIESLEVGPLESVRFLLENLVARGIAAPAGLLISTGAITGVHEIAAGQSAVCRFAGLGAIACRAVAKSGA